MQGLYPFLRQNQYRQPSKNLNVPGQILMSLHIFGIKLYMKNAYTMTFIKMLHKKKMKKRRKKRRGGRGRRERRSDNSNDDGDGSGGGGGSSSSSSSGSSSRKSCT